MDVQDLIAFARKYSTIQQDQFDDFMEGNFDTLNHNAVNEFRRLARFHEDIAEKLQEYDEDQERSRIRRLHQTNRSIGS